MYMLYLTVIVLINQLIQHIKHVNGPKNDLNFRNSTLVDELGGAPVAL